jgi:hypothetical protein
MLGKLKIANHGVFVAFVSGVVAGRWLVTKSGEDLLRKSFASFGRKCECRHCIPIKNPARWRGLF